VRHSRFASLAARRPSLVRLLIALLVSRIVVTIGEALEERITVWSLLITLAVGIEAWRAWVVHQQGKRAGITATPPPASVWDRILTPAERFGPAFLYALTVVFVVAYVVLEVDGGSKDTLLDVVVLVREFLTLLVIAILVVGTLAARDAERARPAPPVPE
jgi:hypothetical protein